MTNSRSTHAVSEVISAILLLAMAVVVFAVIYNNVLSDDGPGLENYGTISGTLANENGDDLQDIVFSLNRGDFLGSDTEVVLDLGEDKTFEVTVEENPDMVQYDSNNNWNIGDKFVYHPKYEDGTLINLNRLNVKANIIDKLTNSIVFWGTLQEGWTFNDHLGGIWHFNEPYSKYSGIEKDVLDSSGNENHGIAREEASHKLKDKPDVKDDNVVSGLGSCFFPGIKGSDVLVEDHYSLNIQEDITIEAWMKPYDEGFIRTTSGFKAQFGFNPDVVKVTDDIYAIAADGKTDITSNGYAIVATAKIGSNGTIGEIVDPDNPLLIEKPGTQPDIVQVYSDGIYNYYAVVYSGASNNNYAGSLMEIKIHKTDGTMEFVSTEGQDIDSPNSVCWPDIIKVNEHIYFITYSDETTITKNGIVYLIKIILDEITGEIDSESQKITIDTSGNDPNIIKISDSIYAIIYRHGNSGYIRTFKVDSLTGTIITLNDPQQFAESANYPDLVHLEEKAYAISYSNINENKGLITTLDIDPSTGSIMLKKIGEVFDNKYCAYPDIINVKDDLYAIVYSTTSGGNPDGRIVTLEISDYGTKIGNINLIVNRFYDPNQKGNPYYSCDSPIFAMISENIFAVIYESGTPHEGQISTFCLLEYPETPFERGVFKSGSVNIYSINSPHGQYAPGIYASVKIVDIVTLDEEEYHLYTDVMDPNDWNHIALTFNGEYIILYSKGESRYNIGPLENPENNRLKTSNEPLMFGYLFFGYIDEIAIIDLALPLNAPDGQDSIQSHYEDPGIFEFEP